MAPSTVSSRTSSFVARSIASSSSSDDDQGNVPAQRPARTKDKPPQAIIDEFWAKFTTKHPGIATTVIPPYKHARIKSVSRSTAHQTGVAAQASYEQAAALCRDKVEKIVQECRRVNKRYRDVHFDLEADLKLNRRDCLQSLSNLRDFTPGAEFEPRSVKRVLDIFDKPQFFVDGPSAHDVRQGRDGDCWLMAALCTLSNKPGLIERVCVARDQEVGVYGFVFNRDGDWISEIIDDQLYVTKADYDESHEERVLWEDRDRVNSEEAYRRTYQTNSGALYFAQSSSPDETWLPLLEKCYAKAHGDFAAIDGGYCGEAIEDLTGGVTTELYTTDILDKERFWKDLLQVNEDFLFGCSTGMWPYGRSWGQRKGIVEKHAYSVMRSVEIDGKRLVMLRNPWGKGEWTGPWSDGSKEWNAEWMQKLNHKFGDDGAFWISFQDLLRKYEVFERTRLFGPEWRITSEWTTLNVPWTLEYHDTYFELSLARSGPVVVVLSQLDDRYFRGLEGQYVFGLAFRIHKRGEESYIVRTVAPLRPSRSVNVDLHLDAGEYDVRVKVEAQRWDHIMPVEDVIRENVKPRRNKLMRIGLSYDIAHSRGRVVETAAEKAAREAYEKRAKEKKQLKRRKNYLKEREEQYYLRLKDHQRKQRQQARERAKKKEREERRRAKTAEKEKTAAAAAEDGAKSKAKADAAEPQPADAKPAETSEVTAESGDGGEQQQQQPPSGAFQDATVEEREQVQFAPPSHADAAIPEDAKTAAPTVEKSDVAAATGTGLASPLSDHDTPISMQSWGMVEATPHTPFTPFTPATDVMSPQPLDSETKGDDKGVDTTTMLKMNDGQQGLGLINVAIDVAARPDDEEDGSKAATSESAQEISKDSQPAESKEQEQEQEQQKDTQIKESTASAGLEQAAMTPSQPQEDHTSDSESESDDLMSLSALSELSLRELDIYVRGRDDDDAATDAGANNGEPDEFEEDPWNAVVVVGLRVYYKQVASDADANADADGEPVVKIKVVRPSAYAEYSNKLPEGGSGSKGLDVDDSAKDSTLEAEGCERAERRKEIVPDA